ncbi:MAG: hypothetical protein M0036_25770 [Desulfobacteraceae bacterium]|nr:hypothetical protein [Desulfobacteraceae bacterium]
MSKKPKKNALPRTLKKRLQEKQRAQKIIDRSTSDLVDRVCSSSRLPESKILKGFPGLRKMSEIIIEYAEPMLRAARSYIDQKKAIGIAIAVWNLSLLPEAKRRKELRNLKTALMGSDCPAETAQGFDSICNFFLNRKADLFPEEDRDVVDFECVETPRGIHLNVVSGIPMRGLSKNSILSEP